MSDKEYVRILSFVNEEEINFFFEKFCNWKMLSPNLDIKGGGIDALFKFYNPFIKKEELIIIESKHVEGNYIRPKVLQDQVNKLKKQILYFRTHPNKLRGIIDSVDGLRGFFNKGIIVHRFEDYNFEKFSDLISKLTLKSRTQFNPPVIYLLNNYHISRLADLYSYNKDEKYYYWFYPNFEQNDIPQFYKNPIPNHLFSQIGIILPKNDYTKDNYYLHNIEDKLLLFYSYDLPNMKGCEYVASTLKKLKIRPDIIKKFIFFEGDHKIKSTYFQNLKNLGIDIEDKENIEIYDVMNRKINNFKVIFRK